MKKRLLLLCCLIALLAVVPFGCESPPKTVEKVSLTYEDGSAKRVQLLNPETQEVIGEIEYYPGKKPFREWHYSSGLRNGECWSYREDGKPWSLNTYVNDTLDGPYKTWHENGNPYLVGQYRKGKRAGVWQFYGTAGNLVREEDFDAANQP